jgi:broad specificity phosphatase PhoE
MAAPARQGRDLVARQGGTVHTLARRLQGDHPDMPMTRAGLAQVDEVARALQTPSIHRGPGHPSA